MEGRRAEPNRVPCRIPPTALGWPFEQRPRAPSPQAPLRATGRWKAFPRVRSFRTFRRHPSPPNRVYLDGLLGASCRNGPSQGARGARRGASRPPAFLRAPPSLRSCSVDRRRPSRPDVEKRGTATPPRSVPQDPGWNLVVTRRPGRLPPLSCPLRQASDRLVTTDAGVPSSRRGPKRGHAGPDRASGSRTEPGRREEAGTQGARREHPRTHLSDGRRSRRAPQPARHGGGSSVAQSRLVPATGS